MKLPASLAVLLLLAGPLLANAAPHPVEQLKHARTSDERIEAYRAIFKYYEFTKPDSAAYYLAQETKEFTASGNKKGIAAALVRSAYLDVDQGRLDMARDKHAKALAISNGIGYKRGVATAHNGLGIIDVRTGNFADGTRHFLEALKLFEETNDMEGVVNTYQKLGTVNESGGNLDKALEYYTAAIRKIELNSIKGTQLIWIYNNIGVVYGKKGNFPEALKYFEMALDGSNEPSLTDVRILTLNNLSIVYDKLGKPEKALSYVDEAIAITGKMNLPENMARLQVSRAAIVRQKDPAAALKILLEALATVKQLGQRNLEADIYDNLGETYYSMGKYKEAVEMISNLRRLEDSLTSMAKAKEITNLQASYQLEKSQAKLSQSEERERATALIRNIVVTVALALAVMLVLLTFIFRKSRQLNKQLKKREDELSKLNATKDKIFSVIGHDLRAPMAHIPPVLQLLDDEDIGPEERSYMIKTLEAHSRASMETLDKLLFWGKNQMTGARTNSQDFKVAELLRNNTELFRTAAEGKRITIHNHVPSDVAIRADASHFDFVIRNLLSNAIKFTNDGGSVTIECDKHAEDGFVTFAVSDTGIGISPSKLQSIFEPFINTTRGTADEKGTGIGLMLCQEFVESNGGNIWVETQPGTGSTFFFTMPKARA